MSSTNAVPQRRVTRLAEKFLTTSPFLKKQIRQYPSTVKDLPNDDQTIEGIFYILLRARKSGTETHDQLGKRLVIAAYRDPSPRFPRARVFNGAQERATVERTVPDMRKPAPERHAFERNAPIERLAPDTENATGNFDFGKRTALRKRAPVDKLRPLMNDATVDVPRFMDRKQHVRISLVAEIVGIVELRLRRDRHAQIKHLVAHAR